jgi:hypothetical protein
MLYHKILENNPGRGREVIGLIGTHHGSGVTHTGLLLAFYMGEELNLKTAFLECNSHHDFELIQEAYDWPEEGGSAFSFQQVTCYKNTVPNNIPVIFGEDYECLILDFGTDFDANEEEFLRCHTKIIIGGRAEWEQLKLLRFIRSKKMVKGNETWRYLIPQANEKIIAKMRQESRRRIWSIPSMEEPVVSSQNINRFFHEIL